MYCILHNYAKLFNFQSFEYNKYMSNIVLIIFLRNKSQALQFLKFSL